MDYVVSEGKHGPIYQIAEGIRVGRNEWGKWEVLMKRDGVRKKRAIGEGGEGLKEAISQAEHLAAQLGILQLPTTDKSFNKIAEEWIETNRTRWTPTTVERYRGIVRDFINPQIGNLPLTMIDRVKVKRILVEVGQIRSPKSVELVHAVISGIFSEAIDLGYTLENPARGLLKKILPPKHKRNQSVPDPLSREDLEKLLASAWKNLKEPLPLVLETLANSGMRLGESLAMRWNQLDIVNRQYMVSETVRGGHFGLPKTGKRLIDLPEPLVKKLEQHIRSLRKKALSEGTAVEFLFTGISQREVQIAMKQTCISAKLRRRTPHDLRHTYATLLLMGHMSPVYVQKQLGHHSITMTVDTYGHWIPGQGRDTLEKVLPCSEPPKHGMRIVERE